MGQPPYKYGEKITLVDAVAIYAHRDMRKHDDVEGAKKRARNRITTAVKGGDLQPASADGKTFLIERFVSWAKLSKTKQKTAKLVDEAWSRSFDDVYEPPASITTTRLQFETGYQYTDEQRVDAFLRTTIPIPEAAAPQAWVDALALALCQIDLLRERNVALEDRLGKLSKAGKAPRSKGGVKKRGRTSTTHF